MSFEPTWSGALAEWLATYLVHSTVLFAAAWLLARAAWNQPMVEEAVWKTAVCGGLATATWSAFGTAGVAPLVVDLPLAESAASAPPAGITAAVPPPAASPHWSVIDWAIVAWLAWAAIGIARLGIAVLMLRSRLGSRVRVTSGPRRSELDALPGGSGVALSRGGAIDVPVAIGWFRGEVCVPATVGALDSQQWRALLAHELAHVLHRDPLWLLVTTAIGTALPCQPLNALVRRRLATLAEYRCDRWAAEQTGDPLAIASCLVDVAETRGAAPRLVPGMAPKRTQLERRVRKLLDGHSRSGRRLALPAAVALLSAALGALPGIQLGVRQLPAAVNADSRLDRIDSLAGALAVEVDALRRDAAGALTRRQRARFGDIEARLARVRAAHAALRDSPEFPAGTATQPASGRPTTRNR